MNDYTPQLNQLYSETSTSINSFVLGDLFSVYGAIATLSIFFLGYYSIMKVLTAYRQGKAITEENIFNSRTDQIFMQQDIEDNIHEEGFEYDALSDREESALRRGDTFRAAVYKKQKSRVVSAAVRKKFY